jgi:hypothetical protein
MKKIKVIQFGIAAILLLCAVLCTEAQTTLTVDRGSIIISGTTFLNSGILLPPKKNTTIDRDTIPVLLLYSDTNYKLIPNGVFYRKAYSVRKIEYINVDVSVDPNITTYLPGGGSMTTLLARVPRYEERPFYTHLEYLDDKKLPLSKSVIIWQSVSR